MERDDIIRMAREARWIGNVEGWTFTSYEELERFAALVAAEKDKQIAFLKDSHDAIRELAYKTGAAEEREATISKIESEICHAEINNLRLAPLFGQQHGPLAVRVDSLVAVADAIRARGEA